MRRRLNQTGSSENTRSWSLSSTSEGLVGPSARSSRYRPWCMKRVPKCPSPCPTPTWLPQKTEAYQLVGKWSGARGRNRTTDTRIFNPKLWMEDQAVTGEISVKPTTANQALTGRLSNHLRARKGAVGGWCGGVFRSVKRYDPSPLTRRRASFPGARA